MNSPLADFHLENYRSKNEHFYLDPSRTVESSLLVDSTALPEIYAMAS